MLRAEQSVPMGEGTELTAVSEWNPYNPVNLDEITPELTIDIPAASEIPKWVNERILGYTENVTPAKYMEQDIDLLKDKLNECLIHEDEFKLLNWMFRIVRGYTLPHMDVVWQMPEDYYRAFEPKYYTDAALEDFRNTHILHSVRVFEDDIINTPKLRTAARNFMSTSFPRELTEYDKELLKSESLKVTEVRSLKVVTLTTLLSVLHSMRASIETGEKQCSFSYADLCRCFNRRNLVQHVPHRREDPYADPNIPLDLNSKIHYLGSGRAAIAVTYYCEISDISEAFPTVKKTGHPED